MMNFLEKVEDKIVKMIVTLKFFVDLWEER
jgi:hypothetical protein